MAWNSFDTLANWVLKCGQQEYVQEDVSLARHLVQAATCAKNRGYSNKVILAALFHDIGHLCKSLPQLPNGLGTIDHEKIGADILQVCGAPGDVIELVRMHVMTKRYLCTIDSLYLSQLSKASCLTLELQGGRLGAQEFKQFEDHPLYLECLQLRDCEDSAKDAENQVMETEIFSFKNLWNTELEHLFLDLSLS